MNAPSIQQLLVALHDSWNKETSFTPEEWRIENPARGQCLVSTLVIQDYLGGDIRRYDINADDFKEVHYCNILPDETVIDATVMQYSQPVQLTITPVTHRGYATARERYMADYDTLIKYTLLKKRVTAYLVSRSC